MHRLCAPPSDANLLGWGAQKFLLASAKAAEGSVHMLLLMLLFMFVFAIMGRDLFAGKLSEGSRPYYDNIFWSFITTFQVLRPLEGVKMRDGGPDD